MIEWPPPPGRSSLQKGNIHVWAVALDDASSNSDRVRTILAPDELARAAKFKFERDRRRFVVAHTAVREILARYLNDDPAGLEFVAVGNGKPKLAARFAPHGIEFNLSHSHERALLAVTQGSEVGVDIEFVKVDFYFYDIAEHFFTSREVAALRVLPAHLQRQAFYKCWTCKEAFLKAKGTGLSGELDEVEIALDQRVRINACVPGWSLAELNPGQGYNGAVVVAGDMGQVETYRW